MKTINCHQLADAIEAFYLDTPPNETDACQTSIEKVVTDLRRNPDPEWEFELIEWEVDIPKDILDEIQLETAVEMNDDDLEGIMNLTHLREID